MRIVYLVYGPSDYNEGKLPSKLETGFTKKEDANSYIDFRPGVQGIKREWSKEKYGDWEVKPFAIFDTLNEAEARDFENMKQHIKKKLSSDDLDFLKKMGFEL